MNQVIYFLFLLGKSPFYTLPFIGHFILNFFGEAMFKSWLERKEENKLRRKKFNARTNDERSDERVCKEAVLGYCKLTMNVSPKVIIAPVLEQSKPDYLLEFPEGNNVILEVTQSGSGFVYNNGRKTQRSDTEATVMVNADSLEIIIADWVTEDQTIILVINHEVDTFGRQFMQKLSNALKAEFYQKSDTIRVEIAIDSNVFFARSTTYYKNFPEQYSPLKLIYAPTIGSPNQEENNNLIEQAKYILKHCIEKKDAKYQNRSEKKWLAIINTHVLMDFNLYQHAYCYLRDQDAIKHSFEKIFIIIENSAYLLCEITVE